MIGHGVHNKKIHEKYCEPTLDQFEYWQHLNMSLRKLLRMEAARNIYPIRLSCLDREDTSSHDSALTLLGFVNWLYAGGISVQIANHLPASGIWLGSNVFTFKKTYWQPENVEWKGK